MKTTTNQFKKMAAAAAFLMCLIMPGISKAQLANPYTVYNGTSCDVQVSYRVFDANCNYVCGGSLIIVAGGNANVTCISTTPNFDDIYMVVNWIGNSSCTANQNILASPYSNCYPASQNATAFSGCASCASVNLYMDPNYVKIY